MILAQALPITVLLILLESVVGGAVVLLYTDLEGRVSRGFLATSGAILAVAAGLAYLLRFGYGSAAADFTLSLGALTGLLALYAGLALVQRWTARLVGLVAVVLGAAALVQSARLEPRFAGPVDLVSLTLATWVVGAALTALLLGHWYLVTPLLSAQSLRRVTEILLVGLGLQVLLTVSQLVPAAGGALVTQRAAALLSTYSFVFWFRVIVGLGFPIALGVLTWYACRQRAMQTATGLLYIALGCVLAGDTAAKVLFFFTSVSL
jgi:hypothetical protein